MTLPENSQAGDNLKVVLKASDRAKDVVSQILAFSRQAEQVNSPIQIGPVIKETLKCLRASIP